MGRPKQRWTQRDTARELGISQATVSNVILIAQAVETWPELAKFKGTAILKAVRFLRNQDRDNDDFSALSDPKVRQAVLVIARAIAGANGLSS